MIDLTQNHTFIVLCYKESPYLNNCIDSLLNQKIKSNIILSTSTPSAFLDKISAQYQLPLVVNKGLTGIAHDWNFGLQAAKTQFVTLAHQDDIYDENYLQSFQNNIEKLQISAIGFTDYYELKNNLIIKNSLLLFVKKLLLLPIIVLKFTQKPFFKKSILRFGDPICCPSLIFNVKLLPANPFDSSFKMNLDWAFLWQISHGKDGFLIINKKLMGHRIHSESTTTQMGEQNIRIKEDLYMFGQTLGPFWAKIITKFYQFSYFLNK